MHHLGDRHVASRLHERDGRHVRRVGQFVHHRPREVDDVRGRRRCTSDGDERGTETVGLAGGVPDEPAGLGQRHDHRIAGRLRNTQVPGDVGEAPGRLRLVREEFRQHHDAFGLR